MSSSQDQREYMHNYYLAHRDRWRTGQANRCACGCGEVTQREFCRGHNMRGMPELERLRRRTLRGVINACLRPYGRAYGTTCALTLEDVPVIPPDCPCCHKKWDLVQNTKTVGSRPTLDRIVPRLGYIPGNVVWVCGECNRRLDDSTSEDLYRLAAFREACEKLISQL